MIRPFSYPLYLSLAHRRALVVGGGDIAHRKAASLLRCGAHVTVVSPRMCPQMERLIDQGVTPLRRRFEVADVIGAVLVIAATDDLEVNQAVRKAAHEERALVNVVDQPELCDFIAPSVLRRGLLTIAISTNGASPALARRIRKDLGRRYGAHWTEILNALSALRDRVFDRLPRSPDRRRTALLAAAELDHEHLWRSGGRPALDDSLNALLKGDLDE